MIIVSKVRQISRVTGKSINGETLPNPNKTDVKYDVGGTDLGIPWDMTNGKVGYFFGDTYGRDFKQVAGGGPGEAGHWRSNVLGISSDKNLSDGLAFDTMVARQLIPSPHITNGTGSHTTIPTAAIHANGKDYVHFMDVRKWGTAGAWTTNYSALYQSTDQGMTWSSCPGVRFGATSNFAQVAYAKRGDLIYMLGTIPGRSGSAYLGRFKQRDILNQPAYEYWNTTQGWIKGKEGFASPIIDGPVAEASLFYSSTFKRWIVTYLNEKKGALVMREAVEIKGAWSDEITMVTSKEYPGLYGAFIVPSASIGEKLYFNMSTWFSYNVFLMEATLKFADQN